MGERQNRTLEVVGSTPIPSTTVSIQRITLPTCQRLRGAEVRSAVRTPGALPLAEKKINLFPFFSMD